MPCNIKNPANLDLSDLEPHVQGMYDHFDQKIGFNKPPTMIFDSDPSNQHQVLGKTAYYDPSSFEIHIYSDGRHPKDMLRSIAHELIHHRQNLEGRLDVGGYHGEGYYLENEELKKLEHEAMLEGNALMREYEDTLKRKENKEMSLKEWKNNELNRLLMKKFGILKEYSSPDDQQGRLPNETEEEFYKRTQGLEETAKPDYLDLDKDGDKKEPMKDAAKDKKEIDEAADKNDGLEGAKDTSYGHMKEDSGEEEKEHYEKNRMSDDEHIKAIEHHLDALRKDKDFDEDHEALEEGGAAARTGNEDRDVGRERMHADRIHEADDVEDDLLSDKDAKESDKMDSVGPTNESLKDAIKRVLKENKKLRLRFKK
jgi:hypothetical protein